MRLILKYCDLIGSSAVCCQVLFASDHDPEPKKEKNQGIGNFCFICCWMLSEMAVKMTYHTHLSVDLEIYSGLVDLEG